MNGPAGTCIAAAAAIALAGMPGPATALPRCEGRLPDTLVEALHHQTLSLLRDHQADLLQARFDERLAAHAAGRRTDEELAVDFAAFARPWTALTPLIAEWVSRHPGSYAAHHAMVLHLGALATRNPSPDALKQAAGWARRATRLDRRPVWTQAWLIAHAPAASHDTAPPPWWRQWLPTAPAAAHPAPGVRRLFDDALATSPDSVVLREAWVQQLAPRGGGSVAALEAFAEAPLVTQLPPDRRDTVAYVTRMTIAEALAAQPAPEAAVAQYQQAAALCRLADPWVAIAEIRLGQKRFADALKASDNATAVSPGSTTALRSRALALRGLGRHHEAVALLTPLAPNGDPQVACLLGDYLATGLGGVRRDPDEAKRLLTRAARAGHGPAVDRLARLIADEVTHTPPGAADVAAVQGPLASPDRRRGSLAP